MKRLAALLLVVGVLVAVTSPVDASTTWTARLGSHGQASLRVGSPDRLTIGAKSLRPSTTYPVTLRRGTCARLGTLVVSSRVTTSATGAGARTLRLTAAQTRAARLPLAIRVGSRCAAFAVPAIVVLPSPSPSPSPTPTPTPSPSPSPSSSPTSDPMPPPYLYP